MNPEKSSTTSRRLSKQRKVMLCNLFINRSKQEQDVLLAEMSDFHICVIMNWAVLSENYSLSAHVSDLSVRSSQRDIQVLDRPAKNNASQIFIIYHETKSQNLNERDNLRELLWSMELVP
jgi:hypothetical protein